MEPIEYDRFEADPIGAALNSLEATEDAIAEAEANGDPYAADYYRDWRQDAMDDLRALSFFSDTPNA